MCKSNLCGTGRWHFNQSLHQCGTRKNKPECVLAKVVYIALVASGGLWNSTSGEQIRLQLCSSASWWLGVSFSCWGAGETQQGETLALQFCGAAPGEGQFTRVGASIRQSRYWKTTVQLVGQHSSLCYICPFISFLLSCGCHSPSQSQVPQRQPLLSLLGCQCVKREQSGGGAAFLCVTILKIAITSTLPHNCVMIANHLTTLFFNSGDEYEKGAAGRVTNYKTNDTEGWL